MGNWQRKLGTAIVLFLTVVFARPAAAGPVDGAAAALNRCSWERSCTFDISTPMGGHSMNSNPGGKARAKGEVIIPVKNTIIVSPTLIKDFCNAAGTGDGLGAYLRIWVELEVIGGYWLTSASSMSDDNGCNNSNYTGPGRRYDLPRNLIRARVQIAECDQTGTGFTCYDKVNSVWMYPSATA